MTEDSKMKYKQNKRTELVFQMNNTTTLDGGMQGDTEWKTNPSNF